MTLIDHNTNYPHQIKRSNRISIRQKSQSHLPDKRDRMMMIITIMKDLQSVDYHLIDYQPCL